MYFNSFHGLSVTCVHKWMTQSRKKKCSQALILFVPDVQFWERKLHSIRKRSVGLEDQSVNKKTLFNANSTSSNAKAITLHIVQL